MKEGDRLMGVAGVLALLPPGLLEGLAPLPSTFLKFLFY